MPAIRTVSVLAGLGLTFLALAPAHAAGEPTGVWLNDTGRGAIEIKPCGDKLCGHVVWVKDTNDRKGCGRQIIGNAVRVGKGLWDGGWIYSPEKKKKYDVELKPLADGNLRVKGYAGTKLFSRTMIWKPAPADLTRCDASETIAKTETAPGPATKAVTQPEPDVVAPVQTPPAPAPVAKSPEPAETAKSEPAPAPPVNEPAAQNDAEPDVAEPDVANTEEAEPANDKLEKIAKRLEDFQRETGYGLKKTENGDCRLSVPFATIRFKCDD